MRLDEFLKLHPFDAIEFNRTKSDSLYEAFKKATATEICASSSTQKKKKKKKKKKKTILTTPLDQTIDQKSEPDPFFGFCPIHQCDFSFSEKRSHELSELFVLESLFPRPIIKIVTGYADFHELDLNPVRFESSMSAKIGCLHDEYSIVTRNLNRFLGTLVKVFRNQEHSAPLHIQSLLDQKTGEISPQAFSDYFVGRLGYNKCMSINFGSDLITCSEERFCSCDVCSLDDLQNLFSDIFGRKYLVYSELNNSLKLPPIYPYSDANSMYRGLVETRIVVNSPFGRSSRLKVPISFESGIFWLDLGSKILSQYPSVRSVNIITIGMHHIYFSYDEINRAGREVLGTIYYSPAETFGCEI
jgi:hypothetical protein